MLYYLTCNKIYSWWERKSICLVSYEAILTLWYITSIWLQEIKGMSRTNWNAIEEWKQNTYWPELKPQLYSTPVRMTNQLKDWAGGMRCFVKFVHQQMIKWRLGFIQGQDLKPKPRHMCFPEPCPTDRLTTHRACVRWCIPKLNRINLAAQERGRVE